MNVVGYFDGACEPCNPGGHASYGALIKIDDETVWRQTGYVGHGVQMSSNVAEYSGAIACMRQLLALEVVKEQRCSLVLRGDSMLVIRQLEGRWRVKNGLYIPYYRVAVKLRAQLADMRLEWVSRTMNVEADALSKSQLRERGIEFTLQREGSA
jgi:ribonuclease HI